MTRWFATIEKVNNGYIIHGTENDDVTVVQEGDASSERDVTHREHLAFAEVVNVLREHFAVHNDKHNGQYFEVKVIDENEEVD